VKQLNGELDQELQEKTRNEANLSSQLEEVTQVCVYWYVCMFMHVCVSVLVHVSVCVRVPVCVLCVCVKFAPFWLPVAIDHTRGAEHFTEQGEIGTSS